MNFLTDKIKPMYLKYLYAAFGSALISSIYGIVDMAMVGRYQGPDGTAALAIVSPVWNIIYSLGLLMGIGGSVYFSILRGRSEEYHKKSNEYFTASLIGVLFLSILSWIGIIFFDSELLKFFGSNDELLHLAKSYLFPIKFVVPCFLFNQFLAAFLRNDGNPVLATRAVLFGGIFNVIGDYFFVFTLDMGIMGAGLATAIGSVLSFLMMLRHFRSEKNSLEIKKPEKLLTMIKEITETGFSTFFIDIAMGILTIFFNRQILKYLGTSELSIYGVIINISTFVQCCAYSIGQASQPIISANFGAENEKRIRETLKYSLITAAFFGIAWTLVIELFPNLFINIFMKPTEEILKLAPAILSSYGISFLLLPFNIFSTYYFQAIMKPRTSFIVSVARGALISGILIYILPTVFGPNSIWFTMVITELIVAIYVAYKIKSFNNELKIKFSK
ncbi:MATE family efflux transporter [Peptoniphilus sp. MSJ-1]|uniref:MATE family efflux transporter n=1 Tax=Peptoniphilus ovalis TaxID=2841503 RepID=A0ABS6FE38_9FIRM|nr:MATE family efflux transporter [Peptoniphilus ovalis]MBU5668453.1 MATE family efflux transporter [Peptoniphilus ovalis]